MLIFQMMSTRMVPVTVVRDKESFRYLGSVHPHLSPHVIAVGLDIAPGEAEENVDSARESVRAAAGAGVRIAGDSKVKTMEM